MTNERRYVGDVESRARLYQMMDLMVVEALERRHRGDSKPVRERPDDGSDDQGPTPPLQQ